MRRRETLVRRRLHREQRDDLEQVILDHIAETSCAFIEAAALPDAKVLRKGQLYARYVVAVPDRLEERIRESEIEDVHDRLLSEIVVDAKDRGFRKRRVRDPVELARRREIAAEGLFDDDPGVFGEPCGIEALDDRREQRAGSPGNAPDAARSRGGLDPLERRRIVVVPADVPQQRHQALERRLVIDNGFARDAFANPRVHFFGAPLRRCDADDRNRQRAFLHHRVETGKIFLLARSPVKPKMTRASERGMSSARVAFAGAFTSDRRTLRRGRRVRRIAEST